VNITPSDGNWPGIGSNPRAKALTASFNVQMTAGDTTGDATMSYYAVAEWNSSGDQDYPAVYDTADTANGTTLAVNSALRIKFTCDDNDGSGSSDDECDATTIRIRRMTDGNTIQLSCPSKQANSDGCETRSGATLNYFNADDGTTRTYNMLVPAGTGSGLWVVEGKFCNENSSCPASPPGGYGGAADTDYQILGHFYVN
jgi:hypothetical protein